MVASANRSMNLSERGRVGAQRRYSDGPKRRRLDEREENRTKNRKRATENAPNLAGATPDAKVGAWTRMEIACIFLGQAGDARCASRRWDMVLRGGASSVFLKAKDKKLDNLQSSWHAQSYRASREGSPGARGLSIWLELKNRSFRQNLFLGNG